MKTPRFIMRWIIALVENADPEDQDRLSDAIGIPTDDTIKDLANDAIWEADIEETARQVAGNLVEELREEVLG